MRTTLKVDEEPPDFPISTKLVAFALASTSAIPMTGTTCFTVMMIVGPL